ncbi:MAG: hypothetical protein ACE5FI_15795, partial [Anaerolineales bacterium]
NEQAYALVNSAQQLAAAFSAEGARIYSDRGAVKLTFEGYFYTNSGSLKRTAEFTTPMVSALSADDNRIEYDYGGLTEWYVNGSPALEHGFLVEQAPPEQLDELVIGLQFESTLQPELVSGQQIRFLSPDGETVFDYRGLAAWDANGRELAAGLALTANNILIRVDISDARFPIIIDPRFSNTSGAAASGDGPDDQFGWSVAVDGDTVIVGAPGESDAQGAAYVFKRDSRQVHGWSAGKKIAAADGMGGDRFGSSVDVSGDSAIVGAPGADPGGNIDQGASYVFHQNADGSDHWGQAAQLVAPNGAAGDQFGADVAISGKTAVVGAPGTDSGENEAQGAAFVYKNVENSADRWNLAAELVASNGSAHARFGASVAVDGETALVGAPGQADRSGAAYFFGENQGGTGAWGLVAEIAAGSGNAGDLFGSSVALSGEAAIVGAPGTASGRGAAHVFARTRGDWAAAATLSADGGAPGDQFGAAVDIDGDTAVLVRPSPRWPASRTGAWCSCSNAAPATAPTGNKPRHESQMTALPATNSAPPWRSRTMYPSSARRSRMRAALRIPDGCI